MKKNGFVSTSLIYTFFIVFLLLMIFLLNSYSSIRFLLDQYKYDIKNSFAEASGSDINLYLMVWDENTQEYELQDEMPAFGYYFEPNFSYCKNGSTISYANGNVSVTAVRRDSCYAYFKEAEKDIILKIYTKETETSDRVLVKNVPNYSYTLTSKNCTNGAILNFNEDSRKFTISSSQKTTCEVEFTKKEMDIIINFFREDALGNHAYNGLKYKEVTEVPGITYTFDSYVCTNSGVNTTIDYENGELVIESSGRNECNVYFNGGTNKVDLIVMQETDTGVSGYTTGLKYSRVSTIPGTGYKYVGYICDDGSASVTYSNGTLTATSDVQTVCRAYFNRYSGSVFIHYYLETSDNNYENVILIPTIGYKYNSTKSYCRNNSDIIVDGNNIVTIDSTNDDECYVYFDMANADIRVNIFVMNKSTGKYELGSVPVAGYELYNAGCTNGAEITYANSSLKVTSEGPTICTVYFR